METSIKEFQEEIAGILNSDEWFGQHDINWLPEDTLNVEYEIKKNLGQTGMVAVVTTPSLDYQGEHKSTATVKNYTETKDGNTTVWTIPDEQGRNIEVTQVKTVTPTKPYDEILEYVEFAGEPGYGEQYIDTGLTVKATTRIEIEYASVNPPATQQYYMLGAFESSNGAFISNTPNTISVQIGSQPKTFSLGGATECFAVVDLQNRMASINGTVQTYTVTPQPTTGTMLIGAARLNGNVVQQALRAKPGVRFKSCKIYDAGILVRDFVAAKKNGVACLFDKVSGQLYYNANQGGRDFIAGPTVEVAPTTVTYSYKVAGGCIPSGLDFTVTPGQTREEIVGDSRYETLLTMDGDTVPTAVSISKESGGTIGKPYDREVEWLENTFATEQPYDAEVEYLESTGTQYIDTELNADSGLGYEIEATFSLLAGGQYCGVLKRPAPYIRMHAGYDSTGTIGTTSVLDHLLGPGTERFAQKAFDGDSETFHFLAYHPDYKEAQTDDVTESTESLEAFDTGLNFYLFGRNDNGTSVNYISQKIRSAKFYRNGVVVRDFIPVRLGPDGYLYDRVSGRMFGNAGTGRFGTGPETYSTTRTSVIDTGVNGSSDINVEVTIAKKPPSGSATQNIIGGSRYGTSDGYKGSVCFAYYNDAANASMRHCVRYDYDATRGQTFFRSEDFPLTAGIVDHCATLNGIAYKTQLNYSTFSSPYSFSLYAFNTARSYLYNEGESVAISNCKIWNSQGQLRDMIPVVKDGVGLFYDKVTGSLFYNQGVAPFSIGPDCTPPITTDSSAATFTDDVESANKGFDVEVSLQVVENPTVNRGKPDTDKIATALDVAHRAIYTLAGYDTEHFNEFSPSTVRQTTVSSAGNKLLQVDARFRATPIL